MMTYNCVGMICFVHVVLCVCSEQRDTDMTAAAATPCSNAQKTLIRIPKWLLHKQNNNSKFE